MALQFHLLLQLVTLTVMHLKPVSVFISSESLLDLCPILAILGPNFDNRIKNLHFCLP